MAFQIGSRVGDYQILALIGAGGAGEVFRVRHLLTGRIEALKVLRPGLRDSPEARERFLREIRLQASLQHSGIAAVYNAYEAGGRLVMVLEYVEGHNLRQHMERGRLDLDTALDYSIQTLTALEYAHSHDMIHRDIKLENILVISDGIVKLTDFGLAKTSDGTPVTKTSEPLGSLWYISPEQVRVTGDIDGRCDVYSFGAVLYEMLTGRPPFQTENAFDLMKAHVETMPVPPVEINPEIPEQLSAAVIAALRKNPGHRYGSALEFRYALEKFPRRGTSGRPQKSAAASAWMARPGKRLLATALTSVLFGLVAATAVTTLSNREKEPLSPPELSAVAAPVRPPAMAYLHTPSPEEDSPEAESPPEPVRRSPSKQAAANPQKAVTRKPVVVNQTEPDKALESSSLPPAPEVETVALSEAPPRMKADSSGRAGKPELRTLATLEAVPGCNKVAFAPGGNRVIVYGGSRLGVWDLTGTPRKTEFDRPGDLVSAAVIAPEQQLMFTGTTDGTVRVWDLNENRDVTALGHKRGITSLTLADDANLLLVGLQDKTVHVWRRDASSGRYQETYRPFEIRKKPAVAVAYSPSANLVAAVSTDDQLQVWRAFGGKGYRIPALNKGASTLTFGLDGDLMAIAGPGELGIWHLPRRARLAGLATGAPLHSVVFLDGGRCVAAAAGGRTVRIWDVNNSDPVVEVVAGAIIQDVVLSRDARRVAALDTSGRLYIWESNEATRRRLARPARDQYSQAIAALDEKDGGNEDSKKGFFKKLIGVVR